MAYRNLNILFKIRCTLFSISAAIINITVNVWDTSFSAWFRRAYVYLPYLIHFFISCFKMKHYHQMICLSWEKWNEMNCDVLRKTHLFNNISCTCGASH